MLIQSLLTLSFVLFFALIDFNQAKSAFLGGFVAIIVTVYTFLKMFCQYDATKPHLLLARFYATEIGRMGLVLALFALIFTFLKPLNIVILLSVFLLNHLLPVFLVPNSMR